VDIIVFGNIIEQNTLSVCLVGRWRELILIKLSLR